MLCYILLNVIGLILVIVMISFVLVIIVEVILSFLGVGVLKIEFLLGILINVGC